MKVSNLKPDSAEFLKQDRDLIIKPAHSAAELRAIPRPSFDEAALRFLARYQSHETRRTYGTTLRELQSFIAQRNKPRTHEASQSPSAVDLTLISEISEEDLLEFRRAIEENHRIKAHANTVRRVQTTIARKISTLRSFFAFAARRGFIEHNPAEHLDAARVLRQSKTKALEPRELGAILAGLEAARHNAETLRKRNAASLSYAVLVTLATTGLRVSELCKLKRGDFLWSGPCAPGELTISRKGGKIQRIYLHPLTATTIQEYISYFLKNGSLGSNAPLFLRTQETSNIGHPTHLTPKAVWNMVVNAARVAGIKGKLPSPHSLRASLATELHRQGVVLHEIQDLLGHSSPETTALYVKKLKQSAESPSLKIKVTQN
jgi:site-specific recombinase XerD